MQIMKVIRSEQFFKSALLDKPVSTTHTSMPDFASNASEHPKNAIINCTDFLAVQADITADTFAEIEGTTTLGHLRLH